MRQTQRTRARTIHRETGQTFYYATRLLPERIREQTYVLYGFFRIADEIVDDGSDRSPETMRAELERLRREALGEEPAAHPVVEAFAEVRTEADIPAEEVNTFLDAMLMDVETDRYETVGELDGYVRGSAAAVGNMMTAIMDVDRPEKARPHAMALGEAFQLTNFLRDVREDARELGRVYLPQEKLRQYGVSNDQIHRERCTPAFRRAIQAELRRAEDRYREGVEGIKYLPEDCQFPVLLAAVLYAEHHRLIRGRNFDVLSARPSLSRPRKLIMIARTWWNWKRFGDPTIVFRRVSAVPETARIRGDVDHGVASPE